MGQPFSDILTTIIKQYISKLSSLSIDVLITYRSSERLRRFTRVLTAQISVQTWCLGTRHRQLFAA